MMRCSAKQFFFFLQIFLAAALCGRELYVPGPNTKDQSAHFLHSGGAMAQKQVRPGTTAPYVSVTRWGDTALEITLFSLIKDIKATGTADNITGIFAGDTMEVFLAPHPDHPEIYYQFAVNPDGVLYQAKGSDNSWRPGKEVTVKQQKSVKGDSWQATFFIPLGAFGNETHTGTWGANFVVNGLNWAGAGDLHSPGSFGKIIFAERPANRPVSIRRMELHEDILLLSLCNMGKQPVELRTPGNVHHLPADNRSHVYRIPKQYGTEIFHKGILPLKITAKVSGSAESYTILDTFTGGDQPDLLLLDSFYYEPAPEIAVNYRAPSDGKITVTEICPNSKKPAKYVFNNQPGQGQIVLKNAKPGAYMFQMRNHEKTIRLQFEIREKKVSQKKSGKLDIKGTGLTLDGKPFYPVSGNAAMPCDLKIEGCLSSGFTRTPNAGYVYSTPAPGKDRKIMPKPNTLYRIAYEGQMAAFVKQPDGKLLQQPDTAAFYAQIYRDLKKESPDALFSFHIDSQTQPEKFAQNCCDVFECAFWGSSYATMLIPNLYRDMAAAKAWTRRSLTDDGKPVILWLGGSLPNGRIRTADELNAAIHLCILNKIAGNVIHLGHGGIPAERTRVWSFLQNISAELEQWYPLWASAEPVDNEASFESGTAYQYEVRQLADGRKLLLAVNLSPFTITCKVNGHKNSVTLPPYGVYRGVL